MFQKKHLLFKSELTSIPAISHQYQEKCRLNVRQLSGKSSFSGTKPRQTSQNRRFSTST